MFGTAWHEDVRMKKVTLGFFDSTFMGQFTFTPLKTNMDPENHWFVGKGSLSQGPS